MSNGPLWQHDDFSDADEAQTRAAIVFAMTFRVGVLFGRLRQTPYIIKTLQGRHRTVDTLLSTGRRTPRNGLLRSSTKA